MPGPLDTDLALTLALTLLTRSDDVSVSRIVSGDRCKGGSRQRLSEAEMVYGMDKFGLAG